MSLADIPQLQSLSVSEKLELITALQDSIAEETFAHHEISDEEKAILDERLAEHEAHPERALSLEEFKRQFAAMRPSWGARNGF